MPRLLRPGSAGEAPRSRRARWFFSIVAVIALALLTAPSADAAPTPSPASSAAAGASGAPAKPSVTFGLGPASATSLDGRPYFTFSASPGSQIADHVAVLNISTEPLPLQLYTTDASNDADGSLAYTDRSVPASQAGGWVKLDLPKGTTSITAAPRSTTIIPFHLVVPKNASSGDHTAGIAVGLVAAISGPSAKNLGLEQRIVTRLFIRVSGPLNPSLAVEKLRASYHGTLNPVGHGNVTVSYIVHNTGNVNLQGKQKVLVSGLFGKTGSTPAVADIPVLLPDGSIPVSLRIPSVWPQVLLKGSVHITPMSLPGAVDPALHVAAGDSSFWAIPWTLLGLLVVVVAACGSWWLVRRRRPSRSPRHQPVLAGRA